MFNWILHYLTLVPKVILIAAVAYYQRLLLWFKYGGIYKRDLKSPSIAVLKNQYYTIESSILPEHLANGPKGALLVLKSKRLPGIIHEGTSDHQAIRHGALSWAVHNHLVTEGLANYILPDYSLTRGISKYTQDELIYNLANIPPAVPLSLAHGLTNKPPTNVELKFVGVVEKLMNENFALSDVSTKPRLVSTAFDAVVSLALLYKAYGIQKNERYIKEANNIFWTKGYFILMLAPLTFKSKENRNYFLDHMFLIGLRTAYLNCPSKIIRWFLKRAMRFVYRQSAIYANPYFAALLKECDALSEKDRKFVLHVHRNADLMEATRESPVLKSEIVPGDWSNANSEEFIFDDLHNAEIKTRETWSIVPLNGLTLGKSLATLMNEDIV